MSDKILHFPTPPYQVNLDRTVQMYTVEELVARERAVGKRDGLSAERRRLAEQLVEQGRCIR